VNPLQSIAQLQPLGYLLHTHFVLISMQREVICGVLKFVLFLYVDILKMMFCTLIFTIFTLVLIIEQQFGFDRHGYYPCLQTHTYPKPPK